MTTTKNSGASYQYSGNIKHLQFSVELSFNGMSFGNMPCFEQFAMQCLPSNTTLDGTLVRPHSSTPVGRPATSLIVDGGSGDGFAIVDLCKIGWQEKIEKPTGPRRERLERERNVPDDPPQIAERLETDVANENINANASAEIRVPQRPSRIFTYIDSELSANKATDGGTQLFTKIRRDSPLRSTTAANLITFDLSREQRQKRRDVRNVQSSMLLMAYIGNFDEFGEANPDDEYVLCRITEINGRIIKVTPDFGTFPLKTRNGTYTVTIRVETPLIFDTVTQRQNIDEDNELASNGGEYQFELPDSSIYWIHYFITIEEAIDFPHENLFVEYQVELPSNVQALDETVLRGRTECCYAVEDGCHDVARFSFTIELTVCYPLWNRQPNEIVTWPRILFRIVSEDYWRRFFVSGYGTVHLPVLPGRHEMNVKCWQVQNTYSHLAVLREFFLGQSIDLKSIEFAGCKGANNEWTNIYSKVGLQTVGSGTLKLSAQCIYQSRQYISRDMMRFIRYGTLMDRIDTNSTMHWRIMKVLHDFELARKQLIRLRSTERPLTKYGVT